jgi:peptide/nickel transport system substrate-binding protein
VEIKPLKSYKTIIYILICLGFIILSGCNSQTPKSEKDAATPTVQADNGGDNKAAEVNSTPTGEIAATEALTAAQETADVEVNPVLVLVADEINTLEPYRMITIHPENSIASHLWDTLTWLNDDLQVEPHLAESWRLVNNFTWEFKLRQGITFHNGEPVDARAVQFSVERAQSMPNSLETFAQEVDLEQVEIVDAATLRFTTRQPVANLPYHLSALEILPPTYYSETDLNQLVTAPAGSGPYRLSQDWLPGEPVALEAVPDYWKGAPALPKIVFKTVSLPEERIAAARLGEAALVTDLPPQPAEAWNTSASRLEVIESTQRMFIGFHIEAGSPLADKRVRQALNYGINVPQIIDEVLEGHGARYGSWVTPPSDNPELAAWPYDPELARDLLTQAGYRDGFTTTLRTPAGVYYQDVAVAEAIARQLGEIGVAVEVEQVDWISYARDLLNDNTPPLFLLGLNSRGDGLEDIKNLSTNFAFNATGWQNDAFENTVKQAVGTFNENSRIRIINEAQTIAYDEAPWIWLWRQYDFYGVSQSLDWTPRRDGLVYLYKSTAASAKDSN